MEMMQLLRPWTHAMTILLPDKESGIPFSSCVSLSQHINLISSPASEAAMGYMRTQPRFWHRGFLMRSLCMLFEKHAPPLMMSLPLSLSTPLYTKECHTKEMRECHSIGNNTLFLLEKAFSSCYHTLDTETKKKKEEHTSIAKLK